MSKTGSVAKWVSGCVAKPARNSRFKSENAKTRWSKHDQALFCAAAIAVFAMLAASIWQSMQSRNSTADDARQVAATGQALPDHSSGLGRRGEISEVAGYGGRRTNRTIETETVARNPTGAGSTVTKKPALDAERTDEHALADILAELRLQVDLEPFFGLLAGMQQTPIAGEAPDGRELAGDRISSMQNEVADGLTSATGADRSIDGTELTETDFPLRELGDLWPDPFADVSAVADSPSLADLLIPVLWPASTPVVDKLKYYQEARLILIKGLSNSGDALGQAQSAYSAARLSFGSDLRLEYALGLALLKHGNPSQASVRFRDAARGNLLPAFQGWLTAQLQRNDAVPALSALKEMTVAVGKSPKVAATDDSRRALAGWIGRLVDFLEMDDRFTAYRDDLRRFEAALPELWNTRLCCEYNAGRAIAYERRTTLRRLSELPEEFLNRYVRARLDEAEERLAVIRAQLSENRSEIESRGIALGGATVGFKRQTQTAISEASGLTLQQRLLKSTIVDLSRPRLIPVTVSGTSTSRVREPGTGRHSTRRGDWKYDSDRDRETTRTRNYSYVVWIEPTAVTAQRLAQLRAAQQQFAMAGQKIVESRRTAAAAIALRKELENQFVNDVKPLKKDLSEAARRDKFLTFALERMRVTAPTRERIIAIMAESTTFAPFDIDSEKSRLLAVFKMAHIDRPAVR